MIYTLNIHAPHRNYWNNLIHNILMIMDARNKSLNDEQAQEIVQDNYEIF